MPLSLLIIRRRKLFPLLINLSGVPDTAQGQIGEGSKISMFLIIVIFFMQLLTFHLYLLRRIREELTIIPKVWETNPLKGVPKVVNDLPPLYLSKTSFLLNLTASAFKTTK